MQKSHINKKVLATNTGGYRALVVFSGQTDLRWLRLLRPGFRHCFVWVECPSQDEDNDAGNWVLCNPLSHCTQMATWPLHGEHILRTWLAHEGYFILETHVKIPQAKVLPWRPYTCVEAVKRVLGLRAPAVLTPWQLYNYIKKEDNMKKFLDNPQCLGY